MRSFVSDILTPPKGSPIVKLTAVTSARAIAAILLDDAGLDPDSLGHGVTVVDSPWDIVSNGVIGLIADALLPTDTVIDRDDNFQDGKVYIFSGDNQTLAGRRHQRGAPGGRSRRRRRALRPVAARHREPRGQAHRLPRPPDGRPAWPRRRAGLRAGSWRNRRHRRARSRDRGPGCRQKESVEATRRRMSSTD